MNKKIYKGFILPVSEYLCESRSVRKFYGMEQGRVGEQEGGMREGRRVMVNLEKLGEDS